MPPKRTKHPSWRPNPRLAALDPFVSPPSSRQQSPVTTASQTTPTPTALPATVESKFAFVFGYERKDDGTGWAGITDKEIDDLLAGSDRPVSPAASDKEVEATSPRSSVSEALSRPPSTPEEKTPEKERTPGKEKTPELPDYEEVAYGDELDWGDDNDDEPVSAAQRAGAARVNRSDLDLELSPEPAERGEATPPSGETSDELQRRLLGEARRVIGDVELDDRKAGFEPRQPSAIQPDAARSNPLDAQPSSAEAAFLPIQHTPTQPEALDLPDASRLDLRDASPGDLPDAPTQPEALDLPDAPAAPQFTWPEAPTLDLPDAPVAPQSTQQSDAGFWAMASATPPSAIWPNFKKPTEADLAKVEESVNAFANRMNSLAPRSALGGGSGNPFASITPKPSVEPMSTQNASAFATVGTGSRGTSFWKATDGGWKPSTVEDVTGMDAPSSSQPSSGGLFGSAQPSNPNATLSNPFAGIGSNQNQASSAPASNSLFARIGTPNPPATQAKSNAFGAATSSSGGGGLFGGGGATSAGGSSGGLFGASTAQSSQPASNSLFANAGPAPQANVTGGNWPGGASNTTTSTQTGGSLFPTLGGGSAASQSQTGSSLFAPKPAQAGSTLFGGSTTPAQPSGGGLFGGASQASQPAGGSLFGGTTQASQPTGGSLFGSTLGGGQTAQPLGQSGQQQLQPNTQQNGQIVRNTEAPRAALFDDLLERGKKRRDPGSDSPSQLPSLQLGLGDISSKIKGLGNQKPDFSASRAHDRAHDSRAHYLLAASGIQQGATRRDLEALANESAAAQAHLAPQDDPRMENYMAGIEAKTIREMMDEAMEQSKRDFDSFLEDNLQINWDYQRRRVYEHLGLVKPGDREDEQADQMDPLSMGALGAFGKSNRRSRAPDASMRGSMRGSMRNSRSVLGGSVGRGTLRQSMFKDVEERAAESGAAVPMDDAYQRSRVDRYAAKVNDLNVARMEETVFPVIEQFARVELESGSDSPKDLVNAYQALRNIVKENSGAQRLSDEGAIRERQYAGDYMNTNPNASASVRMRQQILDGSVKWFEDDFLNEAQEAVDQQPGVANVGGMPTKTSLIRGYLRVREHSKNLLPEDQEPQRGLDGEPIWATIFFLLRGGLIQEAAQYVADNDRVMKTYDRSFPQYISSYASQNRNVPYSLRSRMSREYQQRLSNPAKTNDPYRMACYKVLGRCDTTHPKLDIPSSDKNGLIWLYLVLARETSRAEETAGETFGLENVQELILDIKRRYFDVDAEQAAQGYATCFFLHMLGGMFEAGVAYLWQFNQVAAVHFAIALDFYGLLRVSDPTVDTDLLTYTTRQQPQINFAPLIGYYTQSFRLARPEAAADYIVLMSLNTDLPGETGQKMAQVTHEALKELTLETREFPLLIGDIRNDGRRIKGVIETRLPLITKSVSDPGQFLQTLTVQCAQVAADAGRINDAVLLFHLAEEYDNVIAVVTEALSNALAIDINAEPMRLQPLKPRTQLQNQQQPDAMSSLSLVAVDDPVTLTQNMLGLYNTHALYFSRISEPNRQSAALLLRMAEVKDRIAASRYAEAIDTLMLMDLLPMRAAGNIGTIRSASTKLNQQPPVVARNIGNLLCWALGACGEQRRVLMRSGFDVGGRGRETERELRQCANDLMVFAGLVRYRIGGGVYEMLARAGEGLD